MTLNTPAQQPAQNATASPSRRAKTKKATDHERGFACGVAVACGIAYGSFGSEVEVEEILRACGLETRAKMKALGVDDYDLGILKPLLAQINRK
jgi:hypothetical protein